jgi:hypothetical protein
MKIISLMIALFGLSSLIEGCQSVPLATKANLEPGLNVMEIVWLEGMPLEIQTGIGETFLKYKDHLEVIRNGVFSHRIEGGTLSFSADAINGGNQIPRSYFIEPPKDLEGDIYYQFYNTCLERSMSLAGYKIVKSPEQAESILSYSFEIKEEKDSRIQSDLVPVTSYGWSSTSGTASGSIASEGNVQSSGNLQFFDSRGSFSGNHESQTTTKSVQWVTKIKTVNSIYYNRKFLVNAYSKDHKKQIWRLTVSGAGLTSDPRTTFAGIAAFASSFLGRDSGGEFKYFTGLSDPKIAFIKGEIGILPYLDGSLDPLRGKRFDFLSPELVTARSSTGDSIIGVASKLKMYNQLERLVKAGASPDSTSTGGKPVLALAVDNSDQKLASTLLQLGAKPSTTFSVPSEPSLISVLDYAKKIRRTEMVTLMQSFESARSK